MAICGDTCKVTGDMASVEAHQFSIELSSNEVDVRAFPPAGEDPAGGFGTWKACNKAGTITVQSYLRPDLDVGDEVDFSASIGDENVVVNDCVVTTLGHQIDAKGIVEFSTTLRVTKKPTFTTIE